jgi:hypothetical protein
LHFSQSNSKGIPGRFSRSNSRSAAQDGGVPESFGSIGIGGGWQLAWRWEEGGSDGEEGGLKRVFLRGDGGDISHFTSSMSLPGAPPSVGEPEAFQVKFLHSVSEFSISLSQGFFFLVGPLPLPFPNNLQFLSFVELFTKM